MIKKDEKGFTIVELLTSFSLATVVMVLLFNILIAVKQNYMQNKLNSEATITQGLISNALHQDALKYKVSGIDKCYHCENANYTFDIDFCENGTCFTKRLQWKDDNKILYGENTYELPAGMYVDSDYTKNGGRLDQFLHQISLGTQTKGYLLTIPLYTDENMGNKDLSIKIFYENQ